MSEIVLNTAFAGAFFQTMRSVTMPKRMNGDRSGEAALADGFLPNQQQCLTDNRAIQCSGARRATAPPRFVGGEQQFRMAMRFPENGEFFEHNVGNRNHAIFGAFAMNPSPHPGPGMGG